MHNKIKLVFLSSSDFGVPALKKLALNEKFEVAALITSPEKPKGRGMKIGISAIKKMAFDLGIKILEIENIRDFKWEEGIKNLNPDIMVMASYGKIVPKNILDIPPYGVLNIHPSLLPKFRGPSPIHSAILAGEEKTGITIMLTVERMDAGHILKTYNLKLETRKQSYKKLHDKLAELAANAICDVIPDWILGKIKAEPQDEALATYTKKITKEDGLIDWNDAAEIIERKIRAFEEWPIAYFLIKKNDIMLRIQILESDIIASEGMEVLGKNSGRETGDFFETNGNLAIQTGNGILKLLKVKPEGKKEMSGKDFLLGYKKYLIKS